MHVPDPAGPDRGDGKGVVDIGETHRGVPQSRHDGHVLLIQCSRLTVLVIHVLVVWIMFLLPNTFADGFTAN